MYHPMTIKKRSRPEKLLYNIDNVFHFSGATFTAVMGLCSSVTGMRYRYSGSDVGSPTGTNPTGARKTCFEMVDRCSTEDTS